MFKKSLFLFSLIGIISFSFKIDKNCSVHGIVSDADSKKSLTPVHLYLYLKDSLIANALSDAKGEYCFSNINPGTYKLTTYFSNYHRFEISVSFSSGGVMKQDISLKLKTAEELQAEAEQRQQKLVELHKKQESLKQEIKRNNNELSCKKMYKVTVKDANGCFATGATTYAWTPASNNPDFNTEQYNKIDDNEFKEVSKDPLSTMSIDVDKASYSNVRRFLTKGSLPPADAVRVEEMINYFSYNYPQPKNGLPFSINTEYTQCPWNKKHNLVHIGIQGKEIPMQNLPANNLVFLIDVSGSMMSQDKLPLVKSGLRLLVDQLRTQDHVSLVVYAGQAGLVLPPTSGANKEKIMEAIDALEAGGSTAGGQGIELAYKQAKESLIAEGNNRVILCTDGDFNVGVSSDGDLVRMIEKKREEGVFLTVLGFGTGNYKDSKMEQLADKGNGNYAYIDDILEAKKVLVKEMGGTLLTIAKDVKIQIEFNPSKVKAYRLVGYENRLLNKEDFNDDKKDAGELGSGHTVTAIYEIIPAASDEVLASVDALKYQSTTVSAKASSNEILTVKFRYKEPKENTSRLMTETVSDTKKSASENCRFACAVAEFGMILRDSKFRGESDFKSVMAMAKDSKGRDDEGYRAEFIRLVEMAELLKK